ncbi:MAG TPA: heme biosynthesis HemY N-terminal domain-containing protein [Stellaceae bacterium]|nr:heme biosynthesis HemY N-terminal domain-containing protein [Stellaceae bacterium]
MRVIPPLIVIALLIAAAVFVADRPGTIAMEWQGWHIETSVAVLVLGVVALAMLAAALFHLLRKIVGGPSAFMRRRREKRRRDGYRALTQGMVAVAAGEAEEALKFARKADVLLAEPPLTLLLSAQAAQLNGDEQAAKKYFTAMLERVETEFLGLRGLIMHALRGGDEATALHLVERAKALRPKTPWVLSNHFELLARAGRWVEAEATLLEATKRKALTAIDHAHHRAVLLHEKSRTAESQGETREALAHAAKAHQLDPGFAPAAVRYASLLRVGGRERAAAKVLEAAWRAAPHPSLAEAFGALYADLPPLARLKHVERLAAANPDHPESHIAVAGAALAAKLWGEARRHLAAAGASTDADAPPPTARVSRLMAELEVAEHEDHGAAGTWLARAAGTASLDPTYVCEACGAETASWSPLCPACRAFAKLRWRPPGGATPLRVGTIDAPIVPALPAPEARGGPVVVDAAKPRM